jgi:hypothetical protein
MEEGRPFRYEEGRMRAKGIDQKEREVKKVRRSEDEKRLALLRFINLLTF